MAASTIYWALPVGNGHKSVSTGQAGPQTFALGKRYFQPVAERDDATYSTGLQIFVEQANQGRDVVAFSDGLAACFKHPTDATRGGMILWMSLNVQTAVHGRAGGRIGIKGLRPDSPAIVTVLNVDTASMESSIRSLIASYYADSSSKKYKTILDTQWNGHTLRHYLETNNQTEIDSFVASATSTSNDVPRFYLRAGDKIGLAASYMGYFGNTATPPNQNFHYGVAIEFEDRAHNFMSPELVLAAFARNSLTNFGNDFAWRPDIETMAEINASPPANQILNSDKSNACYSHPLIKLIIAKPTDPFPALYRTLANGKKPIPLTQELNQYHATYAEVSRRLWRYTAGPSAGQQQLIKSIEVFNKDTNSQDSSYTPSGQELTDIQNWLVTLWNYGSNIAINNSALSANNIINDLALFFDISVETMLSIAYQESDHKNYPVRLESLNKASKDALLRLRSQWQLPGKSMASIIERYDALIRPKKGYSFNSSNSINENDPLPNGSGGFVNTNSFTYKELFALLNVGDAIWERISPGFAQATLDRVTRGFGYIQHSPRYSLTQLQAVGVDSTSIGLTNSSSGEAWFKWLLIPKNGYRAGFCVYYVEREYISTRSREDSSKRFVMSHLDIMPMANAYNSGNLHSGKGALWGFGNSSADYFSNVAKAFNAYKLHPDLPGLSKCYLVNRAL